MKARHAVFLAIVMPLIGCACASAEEERPLIWAADSEGGAPYIYKDPNNIDKYVGFEVELIGLLEKELSRKIEYKQYAFKSLIPGIERGDFDLAMNGVEVTPDRQKAVLFSRPYYIYRLQLVAGKDDSRFDDLDGCAKIHGVVGTLEDTAAARLLKAMNIETKVYDNQVDPYTDLANGNLDAVLLDLPIALWYGQPNPKLRFAGAPIHPGYYAIAFRKNDTELAAEVNAALLRLWKDGKLKTIYEKYRIWDSEQERLGDFIGYGDVLGESRDKWTLGVYFPLLREGALVTVELTFLSMGLAIALGLPVAMSRLYGPAPLRWAATAYVEFFRGIPVLLLLFFLYYGLPQVCESYDLWTSIKLPPLTAAILGFGLIYSSYESEIYRAGISSIPRGQWEAAASLGMSKPHTFFRIILPQAIRVILPPMTNDFVALFKDTSVVSVIAVTELTKQYQILSKSSLKYFEIGLATAMLYLVMSVPLGYLSRYLEKRWGKGHA